MTSKIVIRAAVTAEQDCLEALQLRASLTNDGALVALLANPDTIRIPLDGQTELDALFVEPQIRRQGVGRLTVEYCAEVARKQGSTALHAIGKRMQRIISLVGSSRPELSRLVSASDCRCEKRCECCGQDSLSCFSVYLCPPCIRRSLHITGMYGPGDLRTSAFLSAERDER